jgi:hypothetical protein
MQKSHSVFPISQNTRHEPHDVLAPPRPVPIRGTSCGFCGLSVHFLASICYSFMILHRCLLHFRNVRDHGGESEVNEHTTKFIEIGTV